MIGTMRGVLPLAVLLVAVALPAASAKDYTVGDSSGWRPGVDYTAWAKGKTFNVGDTLLFQYNAVHSVEEVSAADHGACSASSPLRSYRDQSTTVLLTNPGTRYFICGTPGHCAAGMKLAVTVSGSGAAGSSPTVRSAKPSNPSSDEPQSESESDTTPAAARTTTAPWSSSSKRG
ncbi:hypothetical protein ACP70R_011215 [Stipagrostis hirtigluma subsp. patula]